MPSHHPFPAFLNLNGSIDYYIIYGNLLSPGELILSLIKLVVYLLSSHGSANFLFIRFQEVYHLMFSNLTFPVQTNKYCVEEIFKIFNNAAYKMNFQIFFNTCTTGINCNRFRIEHLSMRLYQSKEVLNSKT